MKVVFLILILIHGVIHLLGFVKAFGFANLNQLSQPVSKPAGMLWLLTAILFLISFSFLLRDEHSWWVLATVAVLLSEFLIIRNWTDAKFGTILNLIIVLPVILAFVNSLPTSFESQYKAEVQKRLEPIPDTSAISQDEIRQLPPPVQKYLTYVGTVGKPRIQNFRAVFRGSFKRSTEADWMNIASQQYNFFGDRARLFYIRSSVFGVPFDGLHMYIGSNAKMQIKIASVFQVVDAKGEKMTKGDTVTLFNDMCLLAPATLIDTSIEWEIVDSLTVKATFSNKGNTISALLSFNQIGELINFTSNDRYYSTDGITFISYPWSTPVSKYKDFGGRKVPSYAEAVWHTPQGEFSYARFTLDELDYNCTEFK
jgi:hypothetical protein